MTRRDPWMRVFFIRFKFRSLPLQDKCICRHHVGSNTQRRHYHIPIRKNLWCRSPHGTPRITLQQRSYKSSLTNKPPRAQGSKGSSNLQTGFPTKWAHPSTCSPAGHSNMNPIRSHCLSSCWISSWGIFFFWFVPLVFSWTLRHPSPKPCPSQNRL